MKNIYETRSYFRKEFKHNELISKNHKRFCATLNYIVQLLILSCVVSGCVTFASVIRNPIGIANSAAT